MILFNHEKILLFSLCEAVGLSGLCECCTAESCSGQTRCYLVLALVQGESSGSTDQNQELGSVWAQLGMQAHLRDHFSAGSAVSVGSDSQPAAVWEALGQAELPIDQVEGMESWVLLLHV